MKNYKMLIITKSKRTEREIVKPLENIDVDFEYFFFSSFLYSSSHPLSFFCVFLKLMKTAIRNRSIFFLTAAEGWLSLVIVLCSKILFTPIIYRPRGQHLIEYRSIINQNWNRKNPKVVLDFLTEIILRNILLPNVNGIILVSKSIESIVPKDKKYRIVFNPVDIDKFKNINKKYKNGRATSILAVSNFYFPKKIEGLNKFIETYHHFLKQEKIKLRIAGDGPLLKKYREKYASLKNIEFLGHVNNIKKEYEKCDIFVHFSYLDAYPTVILEAWASKLPVMTNNCCGMKEMVEDGKTGFLVSLDDRDEVEKKLSLLITSKETREHLGNNGYQKVKAENNPKKIGYELKLAIEDLLKR